MAKAIGDSQVAGSALVIDASLCFSILCIFRNRDDPVNVAVVII
jgi:hypothetical protein